MNTAAIKTVPKTPQNGFAAFLQTHRAGGAMDEASEKLAELVRNVNELNKPGTLTIVIGVKPASRGNNAVVVRDRITLKAPQHEAKESFRFVTADGRLVENNPDQMPLTFTAQPGGAEAEDTVRLDKAVNA